MPKSAYDQVRDLMKPVIGRGLDREESVWQKIRPRFEKKGGRHLAAINAFGVQMYCRYEKHRKAKPLAEGYFACSESDRDHLDYVLINRLLDCPNLAKFVLAILDDQISKVEFNQKIYSRYLGLLCFRCRALSLLPNRRKLALAIRDLTLLSLPHGQPFYALAQALATMEPDNDLLWVPLAGAIYGRLESSRTFNSSFDGERVKIKALVDESARRSKEDDDE